MILKLKPVLVEKEIWGGHKIKDIFGYREASDRCGEAWGISAHKSFSSTIENTQYHGMTLRELFSSNKELFGNYQGSEFPILVKIIDAKDNLSIQVHPNDDYAKKHNSLGKEECWYILDAEENTEIIIGHTATSKTELHQAIDQDNIEYYVQKFPIQKGDFFYIDAGTLHAICAGTTLLEVQQSSDITYRVYDFNRKQDDGTFREIHKNQAKEVLTVPNFNVNRTHNNRYFEYEILENKEIHSTTAHIHGDYIFIIDGEGTFDSVDVKKGDFLMVSSSSEYTISGTITYQKTTF